MKGISSAGANAGISASIDELNKHGREQTSRFLQNALADLMQLGKLSDLSGVKPFSTEQRLKWLRDEGLVEGLLTKSGDVRPEDKPIIEGMLLRALNDKIDKHLDLQIERDREQDVAISAQAKQIGAVARTLREFKDETESGMRNIRDRQADLNERVMALANDSARTQDDVNFLQKFMFEKMNPGEASRRT